MKVFVVGLILLVLERIMIEGIDVLGNIVWVDILVMLYYCIEFLKFNSFLVYDVLMEGVKVGEICWEYVLVYFMMDWVIVVYFYNVVLCIFGFGLILENGVLI